MEQSIKYCRHFLIRLRIKAINFRKIIQNRIIMVNNYSKKMGLSGSVNTEKFVRRNERSFVIKISLRKTITFL